MDKSIIVPFHMVLSTLLGERLFLPYKKAFNGNQTMVLGCGIEQNSPIGSSQFSNRAHSIFYKQ